MLSEQMLGKITDPFVGEIPLSKAGRNVIVYHERISGKEKTLYLRCIGKGTKADLQYVRCKEDAMVMTHGEAEAYLEALKTIYEEIHEEDFECYWEVEQ